MQVQIVSNFDEFLALEERWNDLVAQSLNDVPFLRHEWFKIWWKHFVKAGDKVRILLVQEGKALLGIAPLMFTKESGAVLSYRVLKLMANSHSMRCDFILHREADHQAVISRMWQEMQRMGGWDYVKLRDVPHYAGESVTIDTLKQVLSSQGYALSLETPRYSPTVISNGQGWEPYFKSRKGHFRRNLNRRNRKLEQEVGPVVIEKIEQLTEALHQKLDEGLRVEASGWKGKQGSAIMMAEDVYRFYHDMAEEALRKGWLKLYYLFAGDKLIAFDYCMTYKQRFYLLKVGYDENFRRYSPGHLLKKYEIQECMDSQFVEYDFLGQKMEWKMEWADVVRPHYTVFIYGKTGRGWWKFFLNVKLLPALRKSTVLRKLKDKFLGT